MNFRASKLSATISLAKENSAISHLPGFGAPHPKFLYTLKLEYLELFSSIANLT